MTETKSLSQREFRNNSAEVMRAVASGESFVLTNSGQPIGKIIPLSRSESELRLTRPAKTRGGFSTLRRHVGGESTEDALNDLRGDR
jgi:prevent-host-death family protein